MAKIPRRFSGNAKSNGNAAREESAPAVNVEQPQDGSLLPNNAGRKVPPTPASRQPSPAPPAYTGVGQAEALYDYTGTDENDLPFHVGDHIIILEYVNSGMLPEHALNSRAHRTDWWRGELRGKEGVFPSNYVKKISDTGKPLEKVPYEQAQQYPALTPGQYNPQQYQPIQYAPIPANYQTNQAQSGAPPPAQQLTVVQDKKNGKLHSIGSKLGNAAIWGAGATSEYQSGTLAQQELICLSGCGLGKLYFLALFGALETS